MESSSPTLTYESNEVVGKNNSNKSFVLLITLGYIIAIVLNFKGYFSNNDLGSIGTFLVLTVFLIVSWAYFLNKKTKLIINKNGIWIMRKGQFSWSQIWYYHIQITFDGEVKYERLHFKLKDIEEEIVISLNNYNVPKSEIISAFQFYADQFQIHDLGLDDHSKGFL